MIAGASILAVVVVVAQAGTPVRVPAGSLQRLQSGIRTAISRVRPAVVDVRARRTPPGGWPYESAGAGVVVDAHGLVLTNQHVVGDSEQITVHLWRRGAEPYLARIVASDPGQDLALLQMAGQGPFVVVAFHNGPRLEGGERVIAIGTPLGLPHSASTGIVSHPQRTVSVGQRTYRDMIQTDATVNQGNSGGPLVNLQGEVVGLVTAIFAPEGVSTGVAFAIPAERLLAFVQRSASAAGFRTVAAATLEPIRIGANMPHPFSAPCTGCHRIEKKLTISINQDMPHKFVGECNTCHVLLDTNGAGISPGPAAGVTAPAAAPAGLAVAWPMPAAGMQRRWGSLAVMGVLIAAVTGGVWWKRRRAQA